ncbi:microsomal glutathione S-transferase 3-like [Branchiostoma floridae]|uniref:Glutathione S-transferase 3, mitochondrial n=1 Tax=Branchiostoma floridae TaxID=7739 RepID=A0A9J7LR12_BRAFL|nr:microsomal glutathione S-transferase 3-like [Branchiostoma floridae]
MGGVSLPREFGYVILTVLGSWGTLMYLAVNVSKARKKYNVMPPILYSDTEMVYNCIQRAHQNALESYPSFLVLLLLAGLKYPKGASAAGAVWCMGRIHYAHGYYTGEPDKRRQGAYFHLSELVLIGMCLGHAGSLLGWGGRGWGRWGWRFFWR